MSSCRRSLPIASSSRVPTSSDRQRHDRLVDLVELVGHRQHRRLERPPATQHAVVPLDDRRVVGARFLQLPQVGAGTRRGEFLSSAATLAVRPRAD
jgi:hypothetical protein